MSYAKKRKSKRFCTYINYKKLFDKESRLYKRLIQKAVNKRFVLYKRQANKYNLILIKINLNWTVCNVDHRIFTLANMKTKIWWSF